MLNEQSHGQRCGVPTTGDQSAKWPLRCCVRIDVHRLGIVALRKFDNVLRGKPVAVIGASTGLFGAVWAQAEARKVLGALGARVLDRELPVGMAGDALADGLDPDLERELASIVTELVEQSSPAEMIAA